MSNVLTIIDSGNTLEITYSDGKVVYVHKDSCKIVVPASGNILYITDVNKQTYTLDVALVTNPASANIETLANSLQSLLDTIPIAPDVAAALALKAPLASPALTGTPTAPTRSQSDNSTKIATTAYVDAGLAAKNAALGADINAALIAANLPDAGNPFLTQDDLTDELLFSEIPSGFAAVTAIELIGTGGWQDIPGLTFGITLNVASKIAAWVSGTVDADTSYRIVIDSQNSQAFLTNGALVMNQGFRSSILDPGTYTVKVQCFDSLGNPLAITGNLVGMGLQGPVSVTTAQDIEEALGYVPQDGSTVTGEYENFSSTITDANVPQIVVPPNANWKLPYYFKNDSDTLMWVNIQYDPVAEESIPVLPGQELPDLGVIHRSLRVLCSAADKAFICFAMQ